MYRLLIAVFAIAIAAVGLTPATAQASVTQSQITAWVTKSTDPQGQTSEVTNGTYLLSLDNPPSPTTIDVKGDALGSSAGDPVDIVCFFGTGGSVKLRSNLPVGTGGAFDTGAIPLRPIAGHACRLRAVPAGAESTSDVAAFAGPQIAVSEAALPLSSISGTGSVNDGKAYNYYVNAVTLTGWAAWKAVGTNGCGPYAAPIDPTFNVGNFAIDCAGSLLADDLGVWGGRSEVQIDGRNAYDASSAQALIPRTGGVGTGTEDLANFPSLSASVTWDPSTGLVSSSSQESWVTCAGADPYKPTVLARDCPSFVSTGVTLQRNITTSDGGRVVTMTDTWSSTDGASHTVDLLYDDYVGLSSSSAIRGYEFPGATTFSSYLAGDRVPAPAAGPGSILVHTNDGASDGNPAEAFGAITYATAPSGFRFAPAAPAAPTPPPASNELEEHALATVPAGGSASLSYVYSVGYSLADVESLAAAAQAGFPPAPVTTPSPPSNPAAPAPVTVTSSSSPSPPPSSSPSTSPSSPAACRVPKIKGMKLGVAEKALRRAGCKVGRIRHVRSRTMARGRVVSTTPRAGRRLPGAGKVELLVSKGP